MIDILRRRKPTISGFLFCPALRSNVNTPVHVVLTAPGIPEHSSIVFPFNLVTPTAKSEWLMASPSTFAASESCAKLATWNELKRMEVTRAPTK